MPIVEHRKHVVMVNIHVGVYVPPWIWWMHDWRIFQCSSKKRDCSYQPSRRGGARRGAQYEETRRSAGNELPASSLSDVTNDISNSVNLKHKLIYLTLHQILFIIMWLVWYHHSLVSTILICPQILCLRMEPSNYGVSSLHTAIAPMNLFLSLMKEPHIYAHMSLKSTCRNQDLRLDQILTGYLASMRTISTSTHICPCYLLQRYRNMKISKQLSEHLRKAHSPQSHIFLTGQLRLWLWLYLQYWL